MKHGEIYTFGELKKLKSGTRLVRNYNDKEAKYNAGFQTDTVRMEFSSTSNQMQFEHYFILDFRDQKDSDPARIDTDLVLLEFYRE